MFPRVNSPCLTQEITQKNIRRYLLDLHRLYEKIIHKLIKEMINSKNGFCFLAILFIYCM